MDWIIKNLPWITFGIGVWAILNGVLHDVFVLKQHKGNYDRDLLRLLMDGHILITCGVMQLIAWRLLNQNNEWGIYLAAAACISLLIYCFMIYPFLKSFGIMSLEVILLIFLAMKYFKV